MRTHWTGPQVRVDWQGIETHVFHYREKSGGSSWTGRSHTALTNEKSNEHEPLKPDLTYLARNDSIPCRGGIDSVGEVTPLL